jgi:hypothetical protein
MGPERSRASSRRPEATIPNTCLVKESSQPHVYFVCGGTKMWIPDPIDFAAVGFKWDTIRSVPDGTLAEFADKPFVPPASTKASDVFFGPLKDCQNFSWNLRSPLPLGRWFPNRQPVESLMARDVIVVGWLVEEPFVNVGIQGCEDVHYNLELDPDFIVRMYGPGGLSARLKDQSYKGNLVGISGGMPTVQAPPLPAEDRFPGDDASRGITFNSFILPGNDFNLHGELNAWHASDTFGYSGTPFWWYHFLGRGAAPPGWIQITVEGDPPRPEGGDQTTPVHTTDAPWFPFNIHAPDGTPLHKGDYVLMRGPIWQDVLHPTRPEESEWHAGATIGHEGWVEMHPIDWIVRLQPRAAGVRKTGRWLVCATFAGQDCEVESPTIGISPDFAPSSPTRRLTVREVEEVIDGRCSDVGTLIPHTRSGEFGGSRWKSFGDRVEALARVGGTSERQGRFKASYIVGWRETDTRDQAWVEDAPPAGANVHGNEPWVWVAGSPKPFSGTHSHQSASIADMHQHFFDSAAVQLAVAPDDILFAMVYIDPDDPPSELMLQWNDGSWEHRAYWGNNRIDWGVDGTVSRLRMGPLPESDAWIRLEVPASAVGLEARTVNGMAFTLFDGRATWDYAGKIVVPPPAALDAAFVSQDVPATALRGEEFDVSITVQNTGLTPWTQAAGFRLGSQNPQDNMRWGRARVDLPVASVPPGQPVTFQFTVMAPNTAVGGFQWRMLREGVAWFGALTPNVRIILTSDV